MSETTGFDPYEVLGVSQDADSVAIRRAYQRLARRHHPDLFPGDASAERRYDTIARAYHVLSDPELRRRFDAGALPPGRRAAPAGVERAPTQPRQPSVRFSYESFLEVHAEWISSEPTEPPGADLTAELTLDFAEALRGVTTSFSVQRERVCDECDGEGEQLSGAPCGRCSGRGRLVDLDRIRVRIPEGVDEGTRLRLPGKGNAAPDEGDSGDLFLTVSVRPHPYFRRRGLDVLADLPVTFAEAALGADVEVPTIDGPVRVRLPAGTSGGQRFRLRGRGVSLPDGRSGDHYYTVRIAVPVDLDEATRSLISRLAADDPRKDLPSKPL
jgi:molecular chaperone DnaJ